MNAQEEAAWEIHQFLTELQVSYAIIGGTAVQLWGEPRLTQDVDLTVATPLDDPDTFIKQILDRFDSRVKDAHQFARKSRVILVKASNDIPLDISLGLPGYEDQVVERAIWYELAPGKQIRLCSAEDLIIHKAVASRPQDIRDIEGVIYRQGSQLDAGYIRQWLTIFAELLENPDIPQAFERPWKQIANVSHKKG